MSDRKYDDEGLERIGGAVAEHLSAKMEVFFESFDTILDDKIRPLRQDITELKKDVKLIKKAITETNKDLRALDKAVGNVEHRVDRSEKIVVSQYYESKELHRAHDVRLTRLEARAA